jgi:hypothetical protein
MQFFYVTIGVIRLLRILLQNEPEITCMRYRQILKCTVYDTMEF